MTRSQVDVTSIVRDPGFASPGSAIAASTVLRSPEDQSELAVAIGQRVQEVAYSDSELAMVFPSHVYYFRATTEGTRWEVVDHRAVRTSAAGPLDLRWLPSNHQYAWNRPAIAAKLAGMRLVQVTINSTEIYLDFAEVPEHTLYVATLKEVASNRPMLFWTDDT